MLGAQTVTEYTRTKINSSPFTFDKYWKSKGVLRAVCSCYTIIVKDFLSSAIFKSSQCGTFGQTADKKSV